MNIKRDKFLTEYIGECWHETIGSPAGGYCWKCQDSHSKMEPLPNNNFSEWDNFGKLWNWANYQNWFGTFLRNIVPPYDKNNMVIFCYMINPDKFADALYKYLKDKT